jgi:hypothetical protein
VEVGDRGVQPDVVERVESRVRLAGRATERKRPAQAVHERPPQVQGAPHVADAHAQPGHGRRPGGEQVGRMRPGGGRPALEDAERAEVHGVVGGLDVPERQVEGSEQVSGQGLASHRRG